MEEGGGLPADRRCGCDVCRKLLALKEGIAPDTDIVIMRYHTAFDEQGQPSFWYYRERLIRNGAGYLWQGAVHEAVTPRGKVVYSDAAVSHRNLR